jgi:hypothetical protein
MEQQASKQAVNWNWKMKATWAEAISAQAAAGLELAKSPDMIWFDFVLEPCTTRARYHYPHRNV